jgi:hypothetical protein
MTLLLGKTPVVASLHRLEKIRISLTQICVVLLAACFFPALAVAQTNDVWAGGTGNWSNSAMWNNGVPTSTSNVFIDNGNPAASVVTEDISLGVGGAQCDNLTIDSDDSLILPEGSQLTVFGSTVSNSGSISLNSAGFGVRFNVNGATTLSGGGTLTMSNSATNTIMGAAQTSPGASLTNKSTVQGAGGIGGGSGIGNGNSFINQGTINATQTTPLVITGSTGQTLMNTGLLEATGGGTLELAGGTVTNTGGTISAGTGSTVLFQGGPTDGTTITGGTFTTTGTGVIADNCCFNTTTLNGVTLSGTFQLNTNHNEVWQGTITNNGTFEINDQGNFGTVLNMMGAVTLKGTGKVVMSNDLANFIMENGQAAPGNSLTNQSTIQGSGGIGGLSGIGSGNSFTNQGTIDADQPDALVISNSTGETFTNTGLMEATNGGTLELAGGTITNSGGTIHADVGSTVLFQGGPTSGTTITGGTLSTTGTGVIDDNCCFNTTTLNGVTIAGTFKLNTNHNELWQGTIINSGVFQMNDQANFGTDLNMSGAVILKGKGVLVMSNDSQNRIMGFGQPSPGASFTNQSTIEGAGQFGATAGIGTGNTLINDTLGTIYADQPTALLILDSSGSFTNNGTLKVKPGSTMEITGGSAFTNFAGQTLTGGKYMVSGTLEFDGADIVTNAASITLTGAKADIINQVAANALSSFASNAKTGSFSLLSKAALTTTIPSGSFSNAGKLTIGAESSFQILAPPQVIPTYTQTAGATTVDGTLTAGGGVTIQGGSLSGKGTVAATVVSSGSVTVGDATTKPGKLAMSTYTQNAKGTLNVSIGGLTTDTQYSHLSVSNGASLNGTLKISLVNGFVPAVNDTFTILTASAVSGGFTTTKGLSINPSEHFSVAVNPGNVTLTVESGP